MKKKSKDSLNFFIKLFIVLALPFFLFRYVGNPTLSGTNELTDEGTRKIAIVNEDLGLDDGSEKITLGKNIPDILGDQTDYSWTLTSRPAAEEGFSKQNFDAIVYIPSNYTKNIMDFKSTSPSKAAITYVIEPNLEAKEHQRIYRQLANAKNSINQEMSSIYWSYVSQEVDILKEQFDKILEKEISFNDAMLSFYQPSSKTLVDEVDQHKSQLTSIVEQTSQTDKVVSDTMLAEVNAQESIVQFAESLQLYKDHQETQVSLLNEFQKDNQEKLNMNLNLYQDTARTDYTAINNTFGKKSDLLLNQKNELNSQFTTIQGGLNQSQNILDDWQTNLKKQEDIKKTAFKKLTLEIIDIYNNNLNEQSIEEANSNFNEQFTKFNESQDIDSSIDSTNPDFKEPEKLEFEQLKVIYSELALEVDSAKKILSENISASESDLDDFWMGIDNKIVKLNDQLNNLEEYSETVHTQSVSLLREITDNYNTLVVEFEDVKEKIIDDIKEKQEMVINNPALSIKRKEELEGNFNDLGELSVKSIKSLANYSGSLTSYHEILNQSLNIDENLANQIISDEAIQNKINSIFVIDESYGDSLENIFGIQNNTKEDNLSSLILEAEQLVANSTQKIDQALEENKKIINEMDNYTNSLINQVAEVNDEAFEWKESSEINSLKGELLFQIQDNTLSNLDNLTTLVSSLDENQSSINAETTDLQDIVQDVQDESVNLNNRWASNIKNTEFVRDDAYDILGNTVIDGQLNPLVYDYLSNPVTLEGQIDGEPLYEAENKLPPIILFIIILLSGLLIGFLSQHYSNLSYFAQSGLFILLTLIVGLVISIYGLNIYNLNDSQTILWSAFTILLLTTVSNTVRAGLFISPFVGWLSSMMMTLYFITPLLNIVIAEFNFNHPISNVYMDLLYGSSSTSYTVIMISLILITISVSAIIYTLQIRRKKIKVESKNEETA